MKEFKIKTKRPLEVLICVITLCSFLFNTVGIGILPGQVLLRQIAFAFGFGEQAWAAEQGNGEASQKAFEIEKLTVPLSLGKVKTVTKGANGKSVIHIQDAHCNYEAQTNIAKILEHLIKDYNVGLVVVEGADGVVDTSWFKAFPDKDIRREVADYFMKKGELTGTEFLSITSDYPFTIYGAEDREHYIKNLNSFLETYPYKESFQKYFEEIKTQLAGLKKYIYTDELKDLDEKVIKHKKEEIEFADYVAYLDELSRRKKVELKDYVNFNTLTETLRYEKDINFDVVNDERAKLIDELSKTLSKDKLSELVERSLDFKLGKIDNNKFYSYLAELAKENKISLAKNYNNLARYIIYARIYSRVDTEALADEIDLLTAALKEKLFVNESQRKLDGLWQNVNIVLGFMNIELTNKEYEYYLANKKEFTPESFTDFAREKSANFGLASSIAEPPREMAYIFPKLVDFYEIATKRDEILVENTFKGMRGTKTDVAVLITGGFHTKGMTKLLEKDGVSYAVISPSITKESENPYMSVLTGQKTPFEKLLVETEKLDELAAPLLCDEDILRGIERRAPAAAKGMVERIQAKRHENLELYARLYMHAYMALNPDTPYNPKTKDYTLHDNMLRDFEVARSSSPMYDEMRKLLKNADTFSTIYYHDHNPHEIVRALNSVWKNLEETQTVTSGEAYKQSFDAARIVLEEKAPLLALKLEIVDDLIGKDIPPADDKVRDIVARETNDRAERVILRLIFCGLPYSPNDLLPRQFSPETHEWVPYMQGKHVRKIGGADKTVYRQDENGIWQAYGGLAMAKDSKDSAVKEFFADGTPVDFTIWRYSDTTVDKLVHRRDPRQTATLQADGSFKLDPIIGSSSEGNSVPLGENPAPTKPVDVQARYDGDHGTVVTITFAGEEPIVIEAKTADELICELQAALKPRIGEFTYKTFDEDVREMLELTRTLPDGKEKRTKFDFKNPIDIEMGMCVFLGHPLRYEGIFGNDNSLQADDGEIEDPPTEDGKFKPDPTVGLPEDDPAPTEPLTVQARYDGDHGIVVTIAFAGEEPITVSAKSVAELTSKLATELGPAFGGFKKEFDINNPVDIEMRAREAIRSNGVIPAAALITREMAWQNPDGFLAYGLQSVREAVRTVVDAEGTTISDLVRRYYDMEPGKQKDALAKEIDTVLLRTYYNAEKAEEILGFKITDLKNDNIFRSFENAKDFKEKNPAAYKRYLQMGIEHYLYNSLRVELFAGMASRLFGEGQEVNKEIEERFGHLSHASHDPYEIAKELKFYGGNTKAYLRDRNAIPDVSVGSRIELQNWIETERMLSKLYELRGEHKTRERIIEERKKIIWDQPRIIIINDATGKSVVEDYVRHNFYGHNPDLLVFSVQRNYPCIALAPDDTPYVAQSSRPFAAGHADATKTAFREGGAFVAAKDGRIHLKKESALDYIKQKTGGRIKIVLQARVNDPLRHGGNIDTPDFSQSDIDMDYLALAFREMRDPNNPNVGANIIIENFGTSPDPKARIKGGYFFQVLEDGRPFVFMIESSAQHKCLTGLVVDEKGLPKEYYNRFYTFYKYGHFDRFVREFPYPIYLRFADGLFRLETVTGDYTLSRDSRTAFIEHPDCFSADYKDEPSIKYGVGACLKQDNNPIFKARLDELMKGSDSGIELIGLNKVPGFEAVPPAPLRRWYDRLATKVNFNNPDSVVSAILVGLSPRKDGIMPDDPKIKLLETVADRVIRRHIRSHIDQEHAEDEKKLNKPATLKRLQIQAILAHTGVVASLRDGLTYVICHTPFIDLIELAPELGLQEEDIEDYMDHNELIIVVPTAADMRDKHLYEDVSKTINAIRGVLGKLEAKPTEIWSVHLPPEDIPEGVVSRNEQLHAGGFSIIGIEIVKKDGVPQHRLSPEELDKLEKKLEGVRAKISNGNWVIIEAKQLLTETRVGEIYALPEEYIEYTDKNGKTKTAIKVDWGRYAYVEGTINKLVDKGNDTITYTRDPKTRRFRIDGSGGLPSGGMGWEKDELQHADWMSLVNGELAKYKSKGIEQNELRKLENVLIPAARGIEKYLYDECDAEKITKDVYQEKIQNIIPNLATWYTDPGISQLTKDGIEQAVRDGRWEDIAYAYMKDIQFGTAGVRDKFALGEDFGKMAKAAREGKALLATILKGPNTFNDEIVKVFTLGILRWLEETASGRSKESLKLAVGFDSRIGGSEFATLIRDIGLAFGVKVYISDEAMPLPEFSCAIKELGLDIGLYISASHNAKECNGLKIIGNDGAQLGAVKETRDAVERKFKETKPIDVTQVLNNLSSEIPAERLRFMGGSGRLLGLNYGNHELVDTHRIHEKAVLSKIQDRATIAQNASGSKILYAAFYGAGRKAMPRMLRANKFNVEEIEAMQTLDGTFPGLTVPDPALAAPWKIALDSYLAQHNGDRTKLLEKNLLFASDPDADRFGLVVRVGAAEIPADSEVADAMGIVLTLTPAEQKKYGFGAFRVVPPNEWGALIDWYDLERMKSTGTIDPARHRLVRSHVTSDVYANLAKAYGIEEEVLPVGVDQIAERIKKLENEGKVVIGAHEESGTYATSFHVRDKDGFLAGVRLAEIAAFAASQNKTLNNLLDEISLNPEIGFFTTTCIKPIELKSDVAGVAKKTSIVRWLHHTLMPLVKERAEKGNPVIIAGDKILDIDAQEGFRSGKYDKYTYEGFPDSGIRFYINEDKTSYVTVRPSGTESKIKVYVQIAEKGVTLDNIAEKKKEAYKHAVEITNAWREIAENMDMNFAAKEEMLDRIRRAETAPFKPGVANPEFLGVVDGYIIEKYEMHIGGSLPAEPLAKSAAHRLYVESGEIVLRDTRTGELSVVKVGEVKELKTTEYEITTPTDSAVVYLEYKPSAEERTVIAGFEAMRSEENMARFAEIQQNERKPIMLHMPQKAYRNDAFRKEKEAIRVASGGAVEMDAPYGDISEFADRPLDKGYTHVFIMPTDELEYIRKVQQKWDGVGANNYLPLPSEARGYREVLTQRIIPIAELKLDANGLAFKREIEAAAVTLGNTDREEIEQGVGNAINLGRIMAGLLDRAVDAKELAPLMSVDTYDAVRIGERVIQIRSLTIRASEDIDDRMRERRATLWSA